MRLKIVCGLMMIALATPFPAMATLGGDEESVRSDQVQMRASLRISRAQSFSIHEMTVASGVSVRQYVSPSGKVFAVSWEGPARPNLRQLLGSYFDRVSAAAQSPNRRRGPLFIQEPGLVYQQGGHMRFLHGKAYIPELVPQGVDIDAIR